MIFMDKRHSLTTILTAPVSKFRFVSLAGQHATSSADVDGVSEEPGGIGDAVTLVTGFSSLVEAADAIALGALVGPSSDGTGRAVAGGTSGRARTAATAAGQWVVVELFRGAVSTPGNPLQALSDNAAAILALIGVSFGSTYVVGDYVAAGYVL